MNVQTAIVAVPIAHCVNSCIHERFSVSGIAIVSREVMQKNPA
jgi:hypothetical protein